MTPQAIRLFFDYTYWAFERVWERVYQLTDKQFTQDVGYAHSSIRNQVIHLISSHNRWIQRMQEIEVQPHLAFEDFPTRAAVEERWDQAKVEFLDYVYALDQTQLNEPVSYKIAGRGIDAENQRWELLLHIANHATDHRSQILSMLAIHFSLETPEQDLLFYLLETANSNTA